MPYKMVIVFKEGNGLFDRVSALKEFLKTSDIIENISIENHYSYPPNFSVSHIDLEKVCEKFLIEHKKHFIYHAENLIENAKKSMMENKHPNFIIPFIKLIREYSETFVSLKDAKEYTEKLVYEGKPY